MTLRVYAGGPAEARALEAWRIVSKGLTRFHEIKAQLLMRLQRCRCYLCCEPMDMSNQGRGRNLEAWTYDHVFPKGVGGREACNILLAHRRCNDAKDARWPTPCEAIYLFAMYAPPYDAKAMRLAKHAHQVARNNRRRYAIEQATA